MSQFSDKHRACLQEGKDLNAQVYKMVERVAEKEIERDPLNYIKVESSINEKKLKLIDNKQSEFS